MRKIRLPIVLSAQTALATLVAAGVAAPGALGGGEPKNESPFTHRAAARTQITHSARSLPATVVSGEPKNELPFTRLVAGS
jgi:hypothetical protein